MSDRPYDPRIGAKPPQVPDLTTYRPATEHPLPGGGARREPQFREHIQGDAASPHAQGASYPQHAHPQPPAFGDPAAYGQVPQGYAMPADRMPRITGREAGSGPTRPPRKRRRWLRRIAWTIGGLGILTAGAVGALVAFAPVGLIRDQVVREVKVRTGRDLVIAGRTSLSVFPALGVSMADVTLSSPPAMGGAPFIQMRRLEVTVPLRPLLQRQVAIDQLILIDPVFELRVDPRGRRNWDFAGYMPAPTVMVAQAPTIQAPTGSPGNSDLEEFLRNASGSASPPADASVGTDSARPGSRARSGSLQDIALGDVRIANGAIRYRDDRSGLAEEVKAINARLSAKSLTSPAEAKGSFALRGDQIDFDARLATPRALMEERPVRLALNIASPRASGRYNGSLSIARGGEVDGNLKLDVPSVRGLAQWAGLPPSAAPSIGVFALEADVKNGATWIALNNAKLKVDQITGAGTAQIDAVPGARPSLKANLKLGAVDLNPFLAARGEGPEAVQAPADKEAAAPPVTRSGAPSGTPSAKISPQVRGFTQRSGWSEERFNLLFLGAFDADIRLSMSSLAYQDIKVGATQLSMGLKNRALRTTFDDIRLYGGQARGVLTLEPTASGTAAIGVNLTADGVSALPLLKDSAGFDWIEGRGKLQIAVSGQGATQKAVMESLGGKADFTFTDGALVGFNIPQTIRGLSQGRIGPLNRVPTDRTEFTEAGASFQIKGGVAETKDLRAISPQVRIAGMGTVNLAQRQVDATLRPKLVSATAGQTTATSGELAGLELPVRIRGPWERPQIAPDLDGILKNPKQAIEAVREFGRQVQQGKGGNLNQLLDQLKRR